MKRDTIGTLRARKSEAGSPSNLNRSEVDTGKSGVSLTDTEVICTFMEPCPPRTFDAALQYSGDWWRCGEGEWLPRNLTLDALHEVEARLTERQRGAYRATFRQTVEKPDGSHPKHLWVWAALHASAEDKVYALAATLRSRVLSKDDAEGTQAIQEKRGG